MKGMGRQSRIVIGSRWPQGRWLRSAEKEDGAVNVLFAQENV
jgi:hypothetical protein